MRPVLRGLCHRASVEGFNGGRFGLCLVVDAIERPTSAIGDADRVVDAIERTSSEKVDAKDGFGSLDLTRSEKVEADRSRWRCSVSAAGFWRLGPTTAVLNFWCGLWCQKPSIGRLLGLMSVGCNGGDECCFGEDRGDRFGGAWVLGVYEPANGWLTINIW